MSNTHIIDNIQALKATIPKDISIVLATKYATLDDIQLISAHFPSIALGENRVQHGKKNQSSGAQNPWHFIGHLQRNKVDTVIQHYQLIHSVDSERLINAIHERSKKNGTTTPLLLQVNPLQDKAKFGFSVNDILTHIDAWLNLPHICLKGLMCMAPFDAPHATIKKTFNQTQQLYARLLQHGCPFSHLSMGMSSDYPIAIDEGSNMIRIGKKVFESPC